MSLTKGVFLKCLFLSLLTHVLGLFCFICNFRSMVPLLRLLLINPLKLSVQTF